MFLLLSCFEILIKLNKNGHFPGAALENRINAIVSNIIMFYDRYIPYALIKEKNIHSNLVSE